MNNFFKDLNSKVKYHFKIYDLDKIELNYCIEDANDTVNNWHGQKYRPDFYINICVKDDAILPSRITKGIKDGLLKIVSTTYSLVTTCKLITVTLANFSRIFGVAYRTRSVLFSYYFRYISHTVNW